MRITICGTGAMACLFGARLARHAEVTLVGTWPEGIEAIRAGGIRVEGGESVTATGIASAALGAQVAPADLLLVLVKSWQTAKVAPHVASLLKPGGAGLTLQNGLGNLEALGAGFCLGTTDEGGTLLGPGHVSWGGSGPTYAAAPSWVIDMLSGAGFEAVQCEPTTAVEHLWSKLSANCGINALTALLRVPNGGLLEIPEAVALMGRAASECVEVARAKGIDLPQGDPAARAHEVARRTARNNSSMLQDILRGAPTECDAINGAVTHEANLLGMAAPVNAILWLLVRAAAAKCVKRDGT